MPATHPISQATFAALSTRQQLSRILQLAHQSLPLYGLPLHSKISLLNYSENATYLIEPPDRGALVLRINRPGYHSRKDIATELAWISALREQTPIVTAELIAGLDGECIQHIWHPGVPEPRNCVLMTHLPGKEPEENNRLSAFSQLGEVTAHLHLHAASWKPKHAIQRHRWDFDAMLGPQPLWGDWQNGLGMTSAKKNHLAKVVKALRPQVAAIGEGRQRFGLIHADLRTANILIHREKVAVIDFDDCGFSWFIYDLAAALSFLETHAEIPSYIDAWLTAYQRIRRLSRAEIAAIPTFIMLRRMLLVAWVGSHSDTQHAKAMGTKFTDDTCDLAENYLSRFS
ncbi:MAG: aminoglycoside phosphotransferase [Verrucomicrobia bacterium]|nr:MAG: aminoglycoside phosphotransferase [Verrucomicrobiota bacterium]